MISRHACLTEVLWYFRTCEQQCWIKLWTCKQLKLLQKDRGRHICLIWFFSFGSLPFLSKRVTLMSVMKREHLSLKCSSIVRPLWRIGTWANKELPLWHIHQNLNSTFTSWECETEKRKGVKEKKERKILYGSSGCLSLVCFLNQTNNDH